MKILYSGHVDKIQVTEEVIRSSGKLNFEVSVTSVVAIRIGCTCADPTLHAERHYVSIEVQSHL
jgi:hypothetical protein